MPAIILDPSTTSFDLQLGGVLAGVTIATVRSDAGVVALGTDVSAFTGLFSTFIGDEAGYLAPTVNASVFLGYQAAPYGLGDSSVAIGNAAAPRAATSTLSGYSVVVGDSVVPDGTQVYRSTVIGAQAGKSCITIKNAVVLGDNAEIRTAACDELIAIGQRLVLTGPATSVTAVGHNSTVGGHQTTCVGFNNIVSTGATANVVLGKTVNVHGNSNVVLGSGVTLGDVVGGADLSDPNNLGSSGHLIVGSGASVAEGRQNVTSLDAAAYPGGLAADNTLYLGGCLRYAKSTGVLGLRANGVATLSVAPSAGGTDVAVLRSTPTLLSLFPGSGVITATPAGVLSAPSITTATLSATQLLSATNGLTVTGAALDSRVTTLTTTLVASGLVSANNGLTVKAALLDAQAGTRTTTLVATGKVSAGAGLDATGGAPVAVTSGVATSSLDVVSPAGARTATITAAGLATVDRLVAIDSVPAIGVFSVTAPSVRAATLAVTVSASLSDTTVSTLTAAGALEAQSTLTARAGLDVTGTARATKVAAGGVDPDAAPAAALATTTLRASAMSTLAAVSASGLVSAGAGLEVAGGGVTARAGLAVTNGGGAQTAAIAANGTGTLDRLVVTDSASAGAYVAATPSVSAPSVKATWLAATDTALLARAVVGGATSDLATPSDLLTTTLRATGMATLAGGATAKGLVDAQLGLTVSGAPLAVKGGISVLNGGATTMTFASDGLATVDRLRITDSNAVQGSYALTAPSVQAAGLSVTGASDLATLTVTGVSTLQGDVTVQNKLSVYDFTVTGPLSASGGLYVTGTARAAVLGVGGADPSAAPAAALATSTLKASAMSSLAAVTAEGLVDARLGLSVSGAPLIVAGGLTVSNGVAGSTTATVASNGSATVQRVTVLDAATVAAGAYVPSAPSVSAPSVRATYLDATDTATAAKAVVGGAMPDPATPAALLTTSLRATGASTLAAVSAEGLLDARLGLSVSGAPLAVAGGLTVLNGVGGATTATVASNGTATVQRVTVLDAATVAAGAYVPSAPSVSAPSVQATYLAATDTATAARAVVGGAVPDPSIGAALLTTSLRATGDSTLAAVATKGLLDAQLGATVSGGVLNAKAGVSIQNGGGATTMTFAPDGLATVDRLQLAKSMTVLTSTGGFSVVGSTRSGTASVTAPSVDTEVLYGGAIHGTSLDTGAGTIATTGAMQASGLTLLNVVGVGTGVLWSIAPNFDLAPLPRTLTFRSGTSTVVLSTDATSGSSVTAGAFKAGPWSITPGAASLAIKSTASQASVVLTEAYSLPDVPGRAYCTASASVQVGSVVAATGTFVEAGSSVPVVTPTTVGTKARYVGVVTAVEAAYDFASPGTRDVAFGALTFRSARTDARVTVSSAGFGVILVSTTAGVDPAVAIGDLLAVSDVSGLAQRQGTDTVDRYTVALATEATAAGPASGASVLVRCKYLR